EGKKMAIKKYRPTSNGHRNMSASSFKEVTVDKPEKSLLSSKRKRGGRNDRGRITTGDEGGGHQRQYGVIAVKRNKDGIPGRVATMAYDADRVANIALIHHVDGDKRYILEPKGLKVGQKIESGDNADMETGAALPLVN